MSFWNWRRLTALHNPTKAKPIRKERRRRARVFGGMLTRLGKDSSAISASKKLEIDAIEHELKTRLSAILASTEILRDYDDLSDSERLLFSDLAVTEIERLTRSVETLLADMERHVQASGATLATSTE